MKRDSSVLATMRIDTSQLSLNSLVVRALKLIWLQLAAT